MEETGQRKDLKLIKRPKMAEEVEMETEKHP